MDLNQAARDLTQIKVKSLPAEPWSLPKVMEDAVRRYPAVQAARAQVAGAVAELEKAQAARWPVVGLGANAQQQGSDAVARGFTPQVSYTVYAGGGIEAGITRAEHAVRAAEGKTAGTLDDVALQAAEAYLLWARAHEQVELARRHVLAVTEIRNDVKKIVDVDPGRAVDLSQAEVRVNAAALLRFQRETDLEQARARLQRYVPDAAPTVPLGLDEEPGVAPQSIEQALRVVGPEHPQLRQAAALRAVARSGKALAWSQLLPKVDVSISRQVNPYTQRVGALSQVSVSVPLFNGGAGVASLRAASQQELAAQSALEEQTLVLQEKIGMAWAEWTVAQERAALNTEQASVGDKLVESYRKQFRLARRSLLDLLNVQSEAYGYATSAVQSRYDRRLARYRLSAAMGELAAQVLPSPPVTEPPAPPVQVSVATTDIASD